MQVGPTVRELAVGPVGLTPLMEQHDDLSGLLLQQAVHRRAARSRVLQPTGVAPAEPPIRPQLTEFKLPAGPAQRPTLIGGLIKQLEQARLGGRVDSAGDLATHPQPSFPSISISFTAICFSASPSRSASALACSSSQARSRAFTPGRDSANAWSAASFAIVRIRMIVERST